LSALATAGAYWCLDHATRADRLAATTASQTSLYLRVCCAEHCRLTLSYAAPPPQLARRCGWARVPGRVIASTLRLSARRSVNATQSLERRLRAIFTTDKDVEDCSPLPVLPVAGEVRAYHRTVEALDTPVVVSVLVGAWRSPVAHLNGVQEVAGSNPVAPTSSPSDLPLSAPPMACARFAEALREGLSGSAPQITVRVNRCQLRL
jgi:hypothetical protein